MCIVNSSLKQVVKRFVVKVILVIGSAVVLTPVAYGNPSAGKVIYGGVDIKQSPHETIIYQKSPKAIVDWKTFNVGPNERVNIQQPPGGVILVRVNPTEGISQIEGNLVATGKVILVNQSGFNFAATSHVQIGI